jgi:SSS family solute:Na+ symporter
MLDVIIVVVYFAAMLGVGWRSRHQSADSYWVAGRQYGSGRITLSLLATIFGASSTMGIIGLGYARGLTGAWWSLIGGIGLIPFALFLAGPVRRLNVYTLPDILKDAYGDRVAVPAGVMIAVAWCGVIAAQLVAGGRLVSDLFSMHPEAALAVVAVVFTLYTLWGGQLSVIRTDSWQLFLFAGGLSISLLFLVISRIGEPASWATIPPAHWQFPVSDAFGWYEVLVFYPLILGLPYLVGPDIYSRTLCARNHHVARKAALWAAGIVIPMSFLLALFGLLACARFPGIQPEAALPRTLGALIPAGLRGLIAAGFLGAIMSSADTCLISASTILTLNVIGPFHGASAVSRHRVTRWMVVLLGGVAWYIASRQQGIIASLLLGYTVFVGGVVIPTLGAFVRRRLGLTSAGAFWAIVAGGLAAGLGKIHGGVVMKTILPEGVELVLGTLLGPYYLSIFPVILSASVLIGVSRFGQRS